MWRRGEPRGSQYMNVNWIGPTIMKYGSEEQKRLHLGPIARGAVLWCQGFSEPEAGSDLASLRTLARADGDDYVVNGSKIWTSYVKGADFCFLLVRTDPESQRHRGISVLLAPMDAPGIVVREVPSVVGERYFHELFFDDARIPVACRLGPPGLGWDVVSYALAYERVGAMRYARAELTLDALAEHAVATGLFEDPVVQEKLGAARAAVEASRLLSYRVIDLRARGSEPTADTNVARVAGTLCENAVSDVAIELFGPAALEYGTFAESYFRLAMTAGVAVGTTEINLNLIASRLLGLPRE
jgi:alkylation response protein AidB-like acyl-CoA dehydrogenase